MRKRNVTGLIFATSFHHSPTQVVRHIRQWDTLNESSLMTDYERAPVESATLLSPPLRPIIERVFYTADYRSHWSFDCLFAFLIIAIFLNFE